jgi:hypothetical protein
MFFIREGTIESQGFIQQAHGELVVRHRHKGIPLIVLNELTLLATPDGDKSTTPGDLLQVTCRGGGLLSRSFLGGLFSRGFGRSFFGGFLSRSFGWSLSRRFFDGGGWS